MNKNQQKAPPTSSIPTEKTPKQQAEDSKTHQKPTEIGGPEGPEPTRYGDWEKGGRCSDF